MQFYSNYFSSHFIGPDYLYKDYLDFITCLPMHFGFFEFKTSIDREESF